MWRHHGCLSCAHPITIPFKVLLLFRFLPPSIFLMKISKRHYVVANYCSLDHRHMNHFSMSRGFSALWVFMRWRDTRPLQRLKMPSVCFSLVSWDAGTWPGTGHFALILTRGLSDSERQRWHWSVFLVAGTVGFAPRSSSWCRGRSGPKISI